MEIVHSPGLPRGFSFDSDDPAAVALAPAAILAGDAGRTAIGSGFARPLCGGPSAFAGCTVYLCDGGRLTVSTASLADIENWAAEAGAVLAGRVAAGLETLTRMRPPFAGLAMDRPVVFGIVNVTPDSFSDGGRYHDPARAIAHGRALVEAGADALDIGGESTRPGAGEVSVAEELDRVVPVIEGLAGCGVPLSVDTRRAAVMEAALDAGAAIVNDVSALTGDPGSLELVARRGAPVILMHMQGRPATMNEAPAYDHAPYEVYAWLARRAAACIAAGVAPDTIAVDPGFGFGKVAAQNRALLADIGLLHATGRPVMAGASRKFGGGTAGTDRLGPSLAAAVAAASAGVQMFRVHDVAETRRALDLNQRLRSGR